LSIGDCQLAGESRPVVSLKVLNQPVRRSLGEGGGDFHVFAIIQASGRQFRVEPGAIIAIDGHNAGEAGGEVSFDQVLLVSNDNGDVTAGTPFVEGAKVLGVVGELDKGKKVRIFKKKRRKQYRRTKGHRSLLTRVRITDIQV
jgi:large subunit ribosomal protein L21